MLDILETIDPDLADFWRTRGRLTHAPVGARAIADVQLNYKTKRELDPTNINASSSYFDESIAVENYAISIPNDWESARVAKLIHDAANGLVEEEEFDRIHDGFKRYLATLEPEFNQAELNDAKNKELLAAYGDVALQEFGMAELNAENVPNERIEHLLKTGQAEMFTEYIGRTPYHAVAMWIPMADGTFRSLIFEYVNAGWTSSGHWRLKSLGPGKQYGPGGSWDLRELVDAYIFDGKRVDQAESIASKAEFVLHFIPLGAAADYASQGEFGEAALSVAGDAAMLLTGGGSKAIGSLASGVRAAKLTNGLRATGIVTEGTIAGIRGWQGSVKLANGDGGYGEIAEALLRVFGVKYALSTKVDDLARAGKSAARASSRIADFTEAASRIPGARWKNFDQLRAYLARQTHFSSEGVGLIKSGDSILDAIGTSKNAAFTMRNGRPYIVLRSGATNREVLHEIGHMLTHKHVGNDAYYALSKPVREQLASTFVRSRQSFFRMTPDEIYQEKKAIDPRFVPSESIRQLLRRWGALIE